MAADIAIEVAQSVCEVIVEQVGKSDLVAHLKAKAQSILVQRNRGAAPVLIAAAAADGDEAYDAGQRQEATEQVRRAVKHAFAPLVRESSARWAALAPSHITLTAEQLNSHREASRRGLVDDMGCTLVTVIGLGGRGKSTMVRDWLVHFGEEELARSTRISRGGQGTAAETAYVVARGASARVMLKDSVGCTSADLARTDLLSADTLVVFLGDGCRAEDLHGDVALLAWRLRAAMRTLFVLPKFDTWRLNHMDLPFEMAVWRAKVHMACELWRVLTSMRAHQVPPGAAIEPQVQRCLETATQDAVWAWLARADALHCWCAADRVARLPPAERALMAAERVRLLDATGQLAPCSMPLSTWCDAGGGGSASVATRGGSGSSSGGGSAGGGGGGGTRGGTSGSSGGGSAGGSSGSAGGSGSSAGGGGGGGGGEGAEARLVMTAGGYTGYVVGGVCHGHGVMRYRGDITYRGEWANGRREGMGELERCDKDSFLRLDASRANPYQSYLGEWSENGRSGRGICKYFNGDVYVGGFCRDRKQGRGTLTAGDGTVLQDCDWYLGAPVDANRLT